MTTPERPALVTAIGWIYVGLGVMAIFIGLMAEGMFWSGVFSPEKMGFGSHPGPEQLFVRIWPYYWLIGIIEAVVGIVLVLVGAAFLKLRPWSRVVAEAIAWLGIAYNIGFGIWWISAVSSMKLGSGASFLGPMMMGMAVFGILIGCVPIVVLIIGLRGKTVRGAFARD